MASDFTMYAGDSKDLLVTIRGPDRQPIDLSGASVRWALSVHANDAPLIEKSTVNSSIEIETEPGVFRVHLSPADTQALAGMYYHEAEIVLVDGTVATALVGWATISGTLINAAALRSVAAPTTQALVGSPARR